MPSILELTDGNFTADLIFDSAKNRRYMLADSSYALAIAGLRKSELGGGGPYGEVEETFDVNVMGETEAEVLANLQNLAMLLDRAERWWKQRPSSVTPVLIRYQIEGSKELNFGVVVGRAPGDETNGVSLPITTHKGVRMRMVERVKLRFRRRGLWMGPNTLSTDSGVATNPNVQTITLSEAPPMSTPIDSIRWDTTQAGSTATAIANKIMVLTTSSDAAASRLQIYEAESATFLGTNVASQADAANKARGGSVARYSPGVLVSSLSQNLSSFDTNCRRVGIWAAVRNNSGTTNFTIQAQVSAGSTLPFFGPIVPIDTSTTLPRIVFLGMIASAQSIGVVALNLTASAAAGTLDIDYLVIQALDDDTSSAFALIDPAAAGGFGGGGSFTLAVGSELLSRVVPVVNSQISVRGYLGDPLIIVRGAQISNIVLGTSSNFWCLVDGANNQISIAFRVVRRRASLVPL